MSEREGLQDGSETYKIRNEYIRRNAQVEQVGDKVREAGLRWFGHALRRDSGYTETLWSYQAGGKEDDLRGGLWM